MTRTNVNYSYIHPKYFPSWLNTRNDQHCWGMTVTFSSLSCPVITLINIRRDICLQELLPVETILLQVTINRKFDIFQFSTVSSNKWLPETFFLPVQEYPFTPVFILPVNFRTSSHPYMTGCLRWGGGCVLLYFCLYDWSVFSWHSLWSGHTLYCFTLSCVKHITPNEATEINVI